MKNAQSVTTIVTLGNAAELTAAVAEKILGGEVADTFSGAPLTKELVYQLAQTTFQKKIAQDLGE
jgi:hypothetical protein